MILSAVSGINCSSLRSSVGKSKQPGFTEPTLALGRGQAPAPNPLLARQLSARFRPRTIWEAGLRPDSPALQPLHSSRSSPAFRRNSIGSMPGLRSFVPTVTKSRDSQEHLVRPQRGKTSMVARLRPTKIRNMARCSACRPGHSNMAARLRPARTSISPRCFARARHRNMPRGFARPGGCRLRLPLTVSTAIFRTLHYAGAPFRRPEKWPTSLVKPDWSDTPLLGYAHGWTRLPLRPPPPSHPLRSTSGESEQTALALARLANRQVALPPRQTATNPRMHSGLFADCRFRSERPCCAEAAARTGA